jgi:hypothetical protein
VSDHAGAAGSGNARRSSARVASEPGRPVAEFTPPAADRTKASERVAVYHRMMARLAEGVSLGGVKIDRDEIYERKDRQPCGSD